MPVVVRVVVGARLRAERLRGEEVHGRHRRGHQQRGAARTRPAPPDGLHAAQGMQLGQAQPPVAVFIPVRHSGSGG